MNLKIKSKIKSDIFRNQAPRVGSFYTRTAALRLWAHRRVFLCHLFVSSSSTHCCSCSTPAFTHLNNCQLCVTLNFQLRSFGSSCLTGNGGSADQTTPAHLQPQMHRLSMETRTCFDSSQLFVPSLLCVQCWSMWRPLALTRQATWFPHISSLFFPCGLPCQQHLVAWEGCGTSEVVGFGVKAWNFLPFLASPRTPPHSSLKSLRKQSEKCLSSYTEESVLH